MTGIPNRCITPLSITFDDFTFKFACESASKVSLLSTMWLVSKASVPPHGKKHVEVVCEA